MNARSLVNAIVVASVLGVALCACGDPQRSTPQVGTNSNWLRACTHDADCDDVASCTCGACTAECNTDMDCAALPGAHCARAGDPAAAATCPGTSASVCLPSCTPGSCGDGQACVAQSCVLDRVPDVAFCAPVLHATAADRTHEDELLAELQQMRASGVAACGGTPAPTLHFDPRLVCDARVLAGDMAKTRSPSVTDSQGRTTEQRFTAAGYAATQWGESFALQAASSARAVELMMSDPTVCQKLASAQYKDVGVGVSGDVYVAAFGSE
jgi:uncharacterized protein YkwD